MTRSFYLVVALLFSLELVFGDTEADPFESWNRAMFAFNQKADSYVLSPVAKGYRAITPSRSRQGSVISLIISVNRSPQ